jgi:hypothetical protein
MARRAPQYWVVGATVQGEDMIDYFVEHGFWFGDKTGTPQQKIRRNSSG